MPGLSFSGKDGWCPETGEGQKLLFLLKRRRRHLDQAWVRGGLVHRSLTRFTVNLLGAWPFDTQRAGCTRSGQSFLAYLVTRIWLLLTMAFMTSGRHEPQSICKCLPKCQNVFIFLVLVFWGRVLAGCYMIPKVINYWQFRLPSLGSFSDWMDLDCCNAPDLLLSLTRERSCLCETIWYHAQSKVSLAPKFFALQCFAASRCAQVTTAESRNMTIFQTELEILSFWDLWCT